MCDVGGIEIVCVFVVVYCVSVWLSVSLIDRALCGRGRVSSRIASRYMMS